MRRLIVLAVATVLAVAACGGESGDTTAEGGNTPTTLDSLDTDTTQTPTDDGDSDESATTTEGSADEGGSGSDDSEGSGPSVATVTLGDETYMFSTEGAVVAQCLTDLFGIFSIQLPEVDGAGGVSIVVLREGTDPETVGEVNSVRVDLGDETWVADEADDLFDQFDQLEPGMSQVDSVEIDGRTVRGTATFFRQNSLFGGGDVETLTGSFEATCGEERTS